METLERKKYKREWVARWRKMNPSKAQALAKKHGKLYKKRHPERVRKSVTKCVRAWRLKYPERVRAQRIVFTELRANRIKKEKCFCGKIKTQAHHADYSKPLKIEWLCKIHHVIADKIRKK